MREKDDRGLKGLRTTAYPVQEFLGLFWTYMGPVPAPGIPLNKIDRTTTFASGPRGFAEYKEDELPPPLPAPPLPQYPRTGS